jgi:pimeloyl-ACP methyl ester carboxylesterase
MNNYIPKILGSLINFIAYFSSKRAAKIAIDLFSTPRKGRITPQESDYLKSAIQSDVSFEDTLIKTYHWRGEKETVLLVHGWESNSFRWKDLITLLQKENYNIVALDAPAHGASGGKFFNALLFAECINLVAKKFKVNTIIGHSVGGMSTVFFQYKYQLKHIERLILLGAPADFLGVFSRYESMMGFNKRVSKALEDYVLKKYNNLPEYFSPFIFSKEITAKGLIIHDKKDRIIPYKDGLKFKQNYNNATFIATKGYGHGLKSERVYQHILNFLNN